MAKLPHFRLLSIETRDTVCATGRYGGANLGRFPIHLVNPHVNTPERSDVMSFPGHLAAQKQSRIAASGELT
ncbi:MAG: hypothetical protein AB3N09_04405 [Tateyamaria sp.]